MAHINYNVVEGGWVWRPSLFAVAF